MLVALLLDQVNVALCPVVMVLEEACMLTDGALLSDPPELPEDFEPEELPHPESRTISERLKQHRRAIMVRRLRPMIR